MNLSRPSASDPDEKAEQSTIRRAEVPTGTKYTVTAQPNGPSIQDHLITSSPRIRLVMTSAPKIYKRRRVMSLNLSPHPPPLRSEITVFPEVALAWP